FRVPLNLLTLKCLTRGLYSSSFALQSTRERAVGLAGCDSPRETEGRGREGSGRVQCWRESRRSRAVGSELLLPILLGAGDGTRRHGGRLPLHTAAVA